jgi:hypothetical protein
LTAVRQLRAENGSGPADGGRYRAWRGVSGAPAASGPAEVVLYAKHHPSAPPLHTSPFRWFIEPLDSYSAPFPFPAAFFRRGQWAKVKVLTTLLYAGSFAALSWRRAR